MTAPATAGPGLPNRILVLGPPGSGKTTLARALADRTGLPLHDLDEHYWLPGWRRPAPHDWAAWQRELVAEQRWIISGNYQSSLEIRTRRAQAAIILAPGRGVALGRLLRRTVVRLCGDGASLPPALRSAPRWRSARGLLPLVRIILRYHRVLLPEARRMLDDGRVPHVAVTSRFDAGLVDALLRAGTRVEVGG